MPISTPVPAAASTGVPAPSAAAGPAVLPHERDEARSKAVEVYDGSAEPRKSRKARHPRIDSRRKPDLL